MSSLMSTLGEIVSCVAGFCDYKDLDIQGVGWKDPTDICANARGTRRNHGADELDASEVALGHLLEIASNDLGGEVVDRAFVAS